MRSGDAAAAKVRRNTAVDLRFYGLKTLSVRGLLLSQRQHATRKIATRSTVAAVLPGSERIYFHHDCRVSGPPIVMCSKGISGNPNIFR